MLSNRQGSGRRASSAPVTFQTETDTLVGQFTTAPTTARKVAINSLIAALKWHGIWDLLDVMHVMAAADSQAARLNWKDPASSTFTLTAVNSPTFTADKGYAGNGSNAYLNTNFTPSTHGSNYTQNSASMWVWSNTDSQSAAYDCGRISTPFVSILSRSGSNIFTAAINDGISSTTSNSASTGLFGIQRRSSSDKRQWKNGAQVGTTQSTASTGLPSANLWIGGANSGSYSSRQHAFFAAGASLSGKEAAFYNAVYAYMREVGNI